MTTKTNELGAAQWARYEAEWELAVARRTYGSAMLWRGADRGTYRVTMGTDRSGPVVGEWIQGERRAE